MDNAHEIGCSWNTAPRSVNVSEDIHVWRVDLEQPESVIRDSERLLAREEQEKAHRFRFVDHRQRFTVTRVAVRQILSSCIGVDPRSIEFATGSHGKPYITSRTLQFNVSHSHARALVAVARGCEIGVDVEKIRDIEDAQVLANRFFSSAEARRLSAASDAASLTRGFFECWTRKEAFVKAIGEGLSHPLDSFEVTFFPETKADLRLGAAHLGKWALRNIDLGPGYCGAVAFECEVGTGVSQRDIKLWEWSWSPSSLGYDSLHSGCVANAI